MLCGELMLFPQTWDHPTGIYSYQYHEICIHLFKTNEQGRHTGRWTDTLKHHTENIVNLLFLIN